MQTQTGEWYIVHLCGRPLRQTNPADAPRFAGARRYMLGRETAIQRVEWTKDGWLRLARGGILPADEAEQPELAECPWPEEPARDDFDGPELRSCWQTLRLPLTERHLSLRERAGFLRLRGGSGLASRFEQSLIAQRLTEVSGEIACRLEFTPHYFKQMAGLILYYDYDNYLYLHVTHDEELGRVITLLKAENRHYSYPFGYLPIPDGAVILRMTLREGMAIFGYTDASGRSVTLPRELDASFLSDEACTEGWFTGTMVGLCCQDLTGEGAIADFDWFEYIPQE